MKPSVAVLYQQRPALNQTNFIPGGGRELGAAIARALFARGVRVITRREYPRAGQALDWVFADTIEGVRAAREAGADTLWLVGPAGEGHPAWSAGVRVVLHPPGLAAAAATESSFGEFLENVLAPAGQK